MKLNCCASNFRDLNLLFAILKLDTWLEGTLTNNRVESGIITASYYGTSERHKGDNEGGEGWGEHEGAEGGGARVEVAYESCQRLIFPSVVGACWSISHVAAPLDS